MTDLLHALTSKRNEVRKTLMLLEGSLSRRDETRAKVIRYHLALCRLEGSIMRLRETGSIHPDAACPCAACQRRILRESGEAA